MAKRTDSSAVKTIWDTDLTDPQIDAFIADANSIITGLLSGAGLSADRLERIEKYTTIHLANMRDPETRKTSGAGTGHEYLERTTDGFWSSTWAGRRAMLLDTSGTLRSIDEAKAGSATELAWAVRGGQQPSDDE